MCVSIDFEQVKKFINSIPNDWKEENKNTLTLFLIEKNILRIIVRKKNCIPFICDFETCIINNDFNFVKQNKKIHVDLKSFAEEIENSDYIYDFIAIEPLPKSFVIIYIDFVYSEFHLDSSRLLLTTSELRHRARKSSKIKSINHY